MRLMRSTAVLAGAVLVAVAGLAAPAFADSPVTISSPHGEEYAYGITIAVTGTNTSATSRSLAYYCTGTPESFLNVDPGSFSLSIGPFVGPANCEIYDSQSGTQLATFTIAGPVTVSSPQGGLFESRQEVIVTGNNASESVETFGVACENSERSPQVNVDPGQFSKSVGSFVGADECRISDSFGALLATFTVAAPRFTITSPQGDEYEPGDAVTVTGYNGFAARAFDVWCDYAGFTEYDVGPGSFSVPVGTFSGADYCPIYDSQGGYPIAEFTVAAPPTRVSDLTTGNGDIFYPLVRDGYKDSLSVRWQQNHHGPAKVRVTNKNGRVVRTAEAWSLRDGRNHWAWNGKNGNGNLVPEGRYRIKVTVNSNTVSVLVTVDTAIVTRKASNGRGGNLASSFATRGRCFASRDSERQVAYLDCWGGSYAKANYRFRVPADAFDVRVLVDLRRTDADLCCRGTITKGWSRPTRRVVVIWAKVTKWRATVVDAVSFTYKHKVRI